MSNKRFTGKPDRCVSGTKLCNERVLSHPSYRPIGILFLITVLSGCTAYHPMPLTKNALAEGLGVPSTQQVRVLAASIQHPLLKPVLFDDRDGLSPDEAAVLAVIANPSLRAARDRRGIAAAQLLLAGILPNPQLASSFESPMGGDTSGRVNALGVGLGWDVTSLVSHSARMDTAKAHAASVDLDVAWQEWQVAEAAKLHLYRLVIAEKQLAIAERLGTICRQTYEVTKRGVTLGVKTASDLSSVKAALQDARAGVLRARSEMEMERLALNRALGLPSNRAVRPEKNVHPTFSREIPPAQELAEGIEGRRLDLLALRYGYESQEASVRAAVRSQFPKISIGPSTARDTDGVQTLGAGIAINIPFFDQNQGRIAMERATRQQLFDEYAARLFEARTDITRIAENLQSIRQQIANADEVILTMKKLAERRQRAADKGTTDILTYYRAENRLDVRQLERLALEHHLADLAVALEIASGRYILTDGLSGPQKPGQAKESEALK